MKHDQGVHHLDLTPSEAQPHIEWLISNRKSFMMHGSPSTAKSWLMRNIAQRLDLQLIDCRLTQYDSVDLRGLPKFISTEQGNDRVNWVPPTILPEAGGRPGVLFLDELPNAGTDVQAAAFQLVLDRKLGEYELPDNWTVAAAGNYRTDMSLTNAMASALKNRFIHLHLYTEVKDYTLHALDIGIHPMIIAFLRWEPALLHAFQQEDETARQYIKNSYAFHTTRTWEMASDVLNSYGVDRFKECFPLIAGSVGLNAATKLQGFVTYYSKLPDIEDLLANPDNYSAPDEIQTRYALTSAISQRTTFENFDNALKFMRKMPTEMQSAWVADCLRKDDRIADHAGFVQWSLDNSSILF